MENKMVKVKRDVMAEKTGLSSMVGEMVEIVCVIPAYSKVSVSRDGGPVHTLSTLRKVYLVVAKQGRFMNGLSRAEGILLTYEGSLGNDVYSEDELEMPQ